MLKRPDSGQATLLAVQATASVAMFAWLATIAPARYAAGAVMGWWVLTLLHGRLARHLGAVTAGAAVAVLLAGTYAMIGYGACLTGGTTCSGNETKLFALSGVLCGAVWALATVGVAAVKHTGRAGMAGVRTARDRISLRAVAVRSSVAAAIAAVGATAGAAAAMWALVVIWAAWLGWKELRRREKK